MIVAGRWEILEPIGSGGFGEVYRARHAVSQNEAALKLLGGRGAHSLAEAERFKREAAAPARIHHPGIAEVLDAGLDPATGRLFLVTELLEGETLRAHLGPGALPLVLRMLEPLSAAHQAGYVHRDLKPDNVFVDRHKGVMLIDFGLARLSSSTYATRASEIFGTPRYMAPEQAVSSHDVTAAADVWAVGVILYEALAGRCPFDGASPIELLHAIAHLDHVPLSLAAPLVEPRLAALVDRCLAKDPAARPAHASALRAELAPLVRASIPEAPGIDVMAATMAVPLPAATPASATPASVTPASATPASVTPATGTPATGTPATGTPATGTPAPATAPRRTWRGAVVAGLAALLLAGGVAAGGLVWWRAARSTHATYEGEGWRLEAPRGWERIDGGAPSVLLALREPGAASTLSLQRVAWPGSLADYVAGARAQGAREGGRVVADRPAALSGRPGHELEIARSGADGGYVQAQRIAVERGVAWMVSCSAPRARLGALRPVCARLFDSVRLDPR